MACGICGGAGHNRRTCTAGSSSFSSGGYGGDYSTGYAYQSQSFNHYVDNSSYSSPLQTRTVRCGTCGESGHNSRTCSAQNRVSYLEPTYLSLQTTRTVTCGTCGQQGHNSRTCDRRSTGAENVITILDRPNTRTVTCGTCGQQGHNSRTCDRGSTGAENVITILDMPNTRTVTCGNCGRQGHNSRTCEDSTKKYDSTSPKTVEAATTRVSQKSTGTTKPKLTNKCKLCGETGHKHNNCIYGDDVELILKKLRDRVQKKSSDQESFTLGENKSHSSSTCKVQDGETAFQKIACSICNKVGHNKTTCEQTSDTQVKLSVSTDPKTPNLALQQPHKRTITCGLCKGIGHTRTTCTFSASTLNTEALERLENGPTDKDGPGFIYMCTKKHPTDPLDPNHFKIGLSMEPPGRRIRAQELANNEEYELVYSQETALRGLAEKVVHLQLKKFRLQKANGDGKTEWFWGDKEIFKTVIKNVAKEVAFSSYE